MTQLVDRMLTLAKRFTALGAQEQQALQGRMIAQGLSLELLPIPPREDPQEAIQASYAQQRLWFLWQLAPEASAYNQPAVLQLTGALDQAALGQSLQALVDRHEALRTNFHLVGERVMQRYPAQRNVALEVLDHADSGEAQVLQVIEQLSSKPFDLEHDLLLRATLIRCGDERHVLVFCTHHIVTDAWSMPILIEEVSAGYAWRSAGLVAGASAPPLAVQYADYAKWQRLWLQAGESERQLAYWRERLGSEPVYLELPLDRPRPLRREQRGARHNVALDAELVQALRQFAGAQGATLFMVLLGSLQMLLHRYCGERRVRVGTPVANRGRAEVQGLIGFFVNTQVMQVEIDPWLSFEQLIGQVKQRVQEAQANQDLPFEQLVDALQPERSLNQSPLFQVLFNHQVGSQDRRRQVAGVELEALGGTQESARFDLTLNTHESGQHLQAALVYAEDIFDASSIARLGAHWQQLLGAALREPQRPLGELSLVGEGAPREGCKPSVTAPTTALVHVLFEQQAALWPARVAVVDGTRQLSYAELNTRANRLAHQLIAGGAGPETLVALLAERSQDAIIGLLATLKAGAAYVPLDPQQPAQRLGELMRNANIRLLLGSAAQLEAFAAQPGLLTVDLQGAAQMPAHNPSAAVLADNPAYLIHTSGSTGRPKGVSVSHMALVQYLAGLEARLPLLDCNSLALVSTLAADLGHTVLFGALCQGRTLHLIDDDLVLDGQAFGAYLQAHAIDALKIVPSHFAALLGEDNVSAIPRRCLILGGEAPSAALLQRIDEHAGECRVFNHYGPTECTVGALAGELCDSRITLGRAFDNRQAHVLDSGLAVQVDACLGELYLGGAGIARGYHGQPGLTAERFVPDPFAVEPGARMYRTGDLARRHGDGCLGFVGRADQQVKIRGYRIETGEIEACLLSQGSLAQALVLALSEGAQQQLIAYLVPKPGQDPATLVQVAADHLRAHLPGYMLPAHWQVLECLPLTANGKLDRKALPTPARLPASAQALGSEAEQRIAALWCAVLHREHIGLDENFFELGGDSIVSIQLVSRARSVGIGFSARDIFQHQTVRSLARQAHFDLATAQVEMPAAEGPCALLPIQQAFFDTPIDDRHHWNQSILLQPRQVLDAGLLAQALDALWRQHDALRSQFTEGAQGWQATIVPADSAAPTLLWVHEQVAPAALTVLVNQVQRSFDLARGELLRAALLTLEDGSQRVLLAVHHLVVDGVSWRILLEDLQAAYATRLAGQALALPARSRSTQQWARDLAQWAQAPAQQTTLDFWASQLQGQAHTLPGMRSSELQSCYRQVALTRLTPALTAQLLHQAGGTYRTQVNDLLLTALSRVLCRWTGQAGISLQLEGHGREELFDGADLSRTVGWFTSLFPVHLTPAASLDASIKQVKEQLRAVPHRGVGFGVLKYLGDDFARQRLQGLNAPRITFNYLGQVDGSFSDDALLWPAVEDKGDERGPTAPLGNWLTVSGQVYQGSLSLEWTFSERMFEPAAIQRLADDYQAELQALIGHCVDAPHSVLTPSDVPLAGLDQRALDQLAQHGRELVDLYPLSPMQQGMLFHTLYQAEAGAYINQLRADVRGLDPHRFRAAWQQTLAVHDILRSGFIWQGEQVQPLQAVYREASLEITLLDWRGRTSITSELDALAAAERARPFNLDQAPLLRLSLVHTADDHYTLVYTHHHILMDGWSSSQLMGEVLQRYHGVEPARPAQPLREYIRWLLAKDPAHAETFWTHQLAGLEAPTRLLEALLANPAQGQGFAHFDSALSREQTQCLETFARAQRVTLNTLVQAAWALLLQRYTGQDSVCFGATVSGRPAELAGIEQQIGLFINTLPVIVSPDPQHTVGAWLQTLQTLNLALREHEQTPLYDIQRWAGRGGESLFDHILVFENFPMAEALQQEGNNGLQFSAVQQHERTNYPLTLAAGLGETLQFQFSHDLAAVSHDAVAGLARQLNTLLLAMANSAESTLGELSLLDGGQQELRHLADRRRVADCATTLPVHLAFQASVARAPDTLAVVCEGQQLSYRSLNQQANRLARRLREQGAGPETVVGIALERSAELVVAVLAVLKAGAAYVPLDPEYPVERLAGMVEDSGARLLLSRRTLLQRLPQLASVEAICLDDSAPLLDDSDLHAPVLLDNLAYVIFTSGSSGRPKGVAVSHRALARHTLAAIEMLGVNETDRVLQFATFNFDPFLEQLFASLSVGATVVMRGNSLWSSTQFLDEVRSQRISVANLSTAYWATIARDLAESGPHDLGALRLMICGGEAMSATAVYDWRRAYSGQIALLNAYGPTETVVTATVFDCKPYLDGRRTVAGVLPIGQALGGRSIYLLDNAGQLAPDEGFGELCIGGELLARGYQGRPGLTAERFIPDSFGEPGARLYRTGDLASEDHQQVIRYLGRLDQQVKIRGFRVEPGEIEARLLEHPQVREVVVQVHQAASGPQLVGYLVLAAGYQAEGVEPFKAWIGAALPGYMVPAHLLLLEALPLSPNGKLDRKALPLPEQVAASRMHQPPRDDFECQVAAIWQQVLQVERVGLNDNFFELGGHSLLATQVIVRLRGQMGLEVALESLFLASDLQAFCGEVRSVGNDAKPLEDELAKSLEALKRLSSAELEKLIS